jgi:membrane protein required for colicin V production
VEVTAFDMMVIAVVGLSTVLAFWRGFVRVVMSLVAWVAAVVLAIHYSSSVGEMLPEFGGSPAARYIAAFALILVGILVLGTLIGWLLARMIRAIGLGFLDRILGALLGVARGVLIVVIGVLIAGLTVLPRQNWWQNSLFAPAFVTLALSLRPWLPQAMAARLDYGPGERARAKPAKHAAVERATLLQAGT